MSGSVLGLLTVIAAGLPSIFAAYFGHRAAQTARVIRQELVTGNDKTVGEMVTEVHGEASAQKTGFDTHGPAPPVSPA